MPHKRKYTDNDVREACAASYSLRNVLILLGLVPAGGNYSLLKKRIASLKIDISHFTGQLWSKGRTLSPVVPVEDYLQNKRSITSYRLKNRLLKENILIPICTNCKLSFWQGHPIPLELHHIDGNSENNLLNNLSLLCPNCHSLTSTYRGKNKNSHRLRSGLPSLNNEKGSPNLAANS